MKSFAVFTVLSVCLLGAHAAVSVCKKDIIDKIKANFQDTLPDLKTISLFDKRDGVVVECTPFYYPFGVKCASVKLYDGTKDYIQTTTIDDSGKKIVGPKKQLIKDLTNGYYYTVDDEGRQIFYIPFYNQKGVIAVYTCANKPSAKKLEDITTDAYIKVKLDTTKSASHITKVLKNAAAAVEEAKKCAEKYGILVWDPVFGEPEVCAKLV